MNPKERTKKVASQNAITILSFFFANKFRICNSDFYHTSWMAQQLNLGQSMSKFPVLALENKDLFQQFKLGISVGR